MLNRKDLDVIMKKCTQDSSLNKNITPKLMRSSLAVHMLNRGADIVTIKEIMGHEDISSTMNYMQLTTDRKKEIVNKFLPR